MFNAEDIIDLEKKWLKYKIKQKSKLYIFTLSVILIISAISYKFLLQQTIVEPKVSIKPLTKKIIIKTKDQPTENLNIISKLENNKTIEVPKPKVMIKIKNDINITKKENIEIVKVSVPPKDIKPYIFKLEATQQGSELFSSNGYLSFNSPFKIEMQKTDKHIVKPLKNIQNIEKPIIEKIKKSNITINTQEIDTITYLKEKFYSTSSIVFALMLSEEYYNLGEYKNSLKWSLTANDIESQNDKSWYWFAKSKVKLRQDNDAIRALKAFLAHNKSQTLSTLLNKIQLGEKDDL